MSTSEKQKIYKFIYGTVLVLAIYLILISLLVHFERDSDQSAITNYTNAIWYSIVTLTTVGYGDVYPVTIYGRIISYVFVFLSMGVYGFMIGQFASLITTFKQNKMLGYNGTTFENHVVIIGWNDFGHLVTEQLIGASKQVAIVTNDKDDISLIHERYDKKQVYTRM